MLSASRLVAPMTFVGLTALSVEIITIARTPWARQASATWRVPSTLVRMPSHGLASTIGTCFSAAAWNTSSGRSAAITSLDAAAVAHVADERSAGRAPGKRSPISRSMP